MADTIRLSPPSRLPLPSRLGLLAVLGSGALLGGAYVFQYGFGLRPCEMCYWQRWPHMAAIAAGLLAVALRGRPRQAMLAVVAAILALDVTAAIGLFHAGVELHWWAGPQACSGTVPTGLSPDELKKYLFGAKMVRCDEPAWKMWGISMAGWNAILSGGLAIALSVAASSWWRKQA